jgi:hypothetical protein
MIALSEYFLQILEEVFFVEKILCLYFFCDKLIVGYFVFDCQPNTSGVSEIFPSSSNFPNERQSSLMIAWFKSAHWPSSLSLQL